MRRMECMRLSEMSIKLHLWIVNGSGADFSKQIPAKFEARVKGKGRIDVYVNNLKGTPLVSLICDGKEWTTLSKKIERKIDKGVENIYFVFNGEGFLFDEWKFIR